MPRRFDQCRPLCEKLGFIKGTINLARGGDKYYESASLEVLRFLWNEMNVALQDICELETLRGELNSRENGAAHLGSLQPRARQVMEAAGSGLRNRQVAARLGISENTVRSHLKEVYRTLGVHNRAQLVRRLCATPIETKPGVPSRKLLARFPVGPDLSGRWAAGGINPALQDL